MFHNALWVTEAIPLEQPLNELMLHIVEHGILSSFNQHNERLNYHQFVLKYSKKNSDKTIDSHCFQDMLFLIRIYMECCGICTLAFIVECRCFLFRLLKLKMWKWK